MKLNRLFIISLSLICFCMKSKAQLKKIEFYQLDSAINLQPRPTIIFIHTDWCKYCLAMKQSTFKNKTVQESINSNYYFVDFNAETRDSIVFNNKIYYYQPTGINTGLHELAKVLAEQNGELVYPTLIIVNSSKNIVYKTSGFISAKQMNFILEQHLQQ